MTDRPQDGETSRRFSPWAVVAILALVVGAGIWAWFRGPFGQDPAYHNFADQRTFFGISNCLNVVSNVPFLLVGGLGLAATFRRSALRPDGPFQTPAERWPFAAFFAGVAVTAIGSAYYHLDPNNRRLVWDRMPMAVAFMGLSAAVVADRVSPRLATRLLPVLVAAGIGTVLYWHWTEEQGRSDLRPYFVVQFGTMAILPVLVLSLPPRYTGMAYLVGTLFWYVVAKVCEHPFDGPIYDRLGWVSGHTLKHLAAAAAAYCVLRWITVRVPVAPPNSPAGVTE